MRLSALAAFAVVLASASHALLVHPGDTLAMVQTNPAVTGSLLAGTTQTFVGTNALSQVLYTGSVTSTVYQDAGGLTFYYQVTNNATSTEGISRFGVNGFGGFTTDVDATAAFGGSNLPVLVDRANSNTVDFTFDTFPVIGGAGPLQPGTSSLVLVVHTNATQYTLQSAQVIDGAVGTTFALAPVPEPTSVAALGLGAVALLRRRKKA